MDKRHVIFEEYLKSPNTNYACIINGDWGAGKTYWLKTQIKPLIEKTETIEDTRIKYKFVYISLYGINSVQELQNIIFFEFYYLLKNSKLKAAFDLTKIVGEAFLKYKGIDGIGKLFTTIESHAKNYVSLNRLVICFDDIERKGTKLDINDLAGFINNLTENQNTKVLLLLNDKKIDDKESIRGKLDGVSITYNPIISEIFADIFNKNYQSYSGYSKFLNSQINILIDLHASGLNNLRYYIYGITKFQKVYSAITNEFVGKKKNKYHTNELLSDCFRFSIAIAYEFKQGKSAEYIVQELSLAGLASTERLMRQIQNKSQEREKTYRELFYEKYHYKKSYNYFNSLTKYILGFEDFNVAFFESELMNFSDYVKAILSESEQLFSDLRYQNCFELTDQEVIDKTKQLYDKAKNGEFSLYNYPTIFHFITRFGNPLGLDKDNLVLELKQGIDMHVKNNPVYNKFLDRHMGFFTKDPDINYINELITYAIKANESLFSDDQTKYSQELFENFKSDAAKFIEDYVTDEKKSKDYISIFSRFDVSETLNTLNNSKNSCLQDFSRIIEYRYKHYFDGHDPDLEFLIKLKAGIEAQTLVNLPVKQSLYTVLNEILSKSIETLTNGKKK